MITIDEFRKLELKIAQIKDVKDHPNADKLYLIKVSTGTEEKELVAGVKKSYRPEELIGKFVVIVDNLEPAVIRGVESKGMILAAQGEGEIAVLTPDRPVAPGSTVK
ncbi:MAG: hypothetical protein WC569_02735 [Candidatus Omnitrophota bacterium]